MKVSDVMTTPAITATPEDLLADVIPIMIEKKLSGVPVVDTTGVLVGVMSEGDLLRRIELGTSSLKEGFWTKLFAFGSEAERYRRVNGRRVRDVMTEKPVTVDERDTLADAARLMHTFKVKRLPVVREGKVVGMLSRSDFVKTLGQFLAPGYEDVIVSDDEIVTKVREEISRQGWSANCSVTVLSSNGDVTLRGYAPTDAQRRSLVVATETINGVRTVTDHIDVYDPAPMIGV